MWIKLWLGEEADIQDLRCIEDGGARKLLSRLNLPNCGENIYSLTHTHSWMDMSLFTLRSSREKTEANSNLYSLRVCQWSWELQDVCVPSFVQGHKLLFTLYKHCMVGQMWTSVNCGLSLFGDLSMLYLVCGLLPAGIVSSSLAVKQHETNE